MIMHLFPLALALVCSRCSAFASVGVVQPKIMSRVSRNHSHRVYSALAAAVLPGQPTELPDSLKDAAVRAAEASVEFLRQTGPGNGRCRVDFDTSVGDETFTLLKQSTEFAQHYVTALSYAVLPSLLQQKQTEIAGVAQAKAELLQLQNEAAAVVDGTAERQDREQREDALVQLIARNGRDFSNDSKWQGKTVRVYFPDEGNAALARRDWTAQVPPCVQFSSCGGVQRQNDISQDVIALFFCPRASESDSVEEILARYSALAVTTDESALQLTVFVNPYLVDMGVTGFGMAGRRLRERLIDGLTGVYYLRTLPWGALTRQWPACYTLWQEDADADGGYKLVQTMDRLPSNPEVEDIYDIANGNMERPSSGGLLDQFGDFVNGMMRL